MSFSAGALLGATALGGLLGAGSSAVSGLMNYQSAKKLQQHQYDLNRNALREQYQNTRYSLTQAGYNPLLAVGSSAQGFSANSSGVNPDLSSGVSSGVNSAIALQQSKAQIDNIKADTDVKKYGQKGATVKNLIELGKNSKNPNVQRIVDKAVTAELAPVSFSAIDSFSNQHPTLTRAMKKLSNFDFRGAGYEIGHTLGTRFKSRHSAVSNERFRELSDDELYHYKGSRRKSYYNSVPRTSLR